MQVPIKRKASKDQADKIVPAFRNILTSSDTIARSAPKNPLRKGSGEEWMSRFRNDFCRDREANRALTNKGA